VINLRRIDLNLLTIFEAVYEERNQVKAAERLAMTQPAVSQAIGRLRHLVNDPLFFTRARGLTPTQKAEELYLRVHHILELVRVEFPEKQAFDPATTQRTFVVAVSHGGGVLFTTALNARIQAQAPHARLVIRTIDPIREIPELLKEHRLDIAIHHARFDDAKLEHITYDQNQLVLIARTDHPRIPKSPSTEDLLGENFVTAYDVFGHNRSHELSHTLAVMRDRTVLEVPNALLIPQVVRQSDLLAVVTAEMAKSFSQYLPIQAFVLPFAVPALDIHMIWHHSQTQEPEHKWLRQQLLEMRNTWTSTTTSTSNPAPPVILQQPHE
jgi:DNA-binding transcriptional LysR family regulator